MSLPIIFNAAVETAKISFPTVLEARRGTLTPESCDLRLRSWSNRLLTRVKAKVLVQGLDQLDTLPGPYIVVSNHQSQYDIPCLYEALPLRLRMAAKKELFKTPLWGAALKASGFVEIDRSSPKAAYRALKTAGQRMRSEDFSLFIAPEGTRSEDGSLGPFKRGAFDIARITQLPILPVAISGSINIHRKGSRKVHHGMQVTVTLLPPRPAPARSAGDKFIEHVRSELASVLGHSS